MADVHVQFQFEGDLSMWAAHLENLEDASFRAVHTLEQVLHDAFADTQEKVHRITGSLADSGTTSSEFVHDNWQGQISYGGSSGGNVHDPVTYSIYEMARGGDHDFYRDLPIVFYPRFQAAIADAIKGGPHARA